MTTPTPDTWGELRSATADRDLERALFIALELEGLEQLAALHYVSREASIETFDPEVMRALMSKHGWTVRASYAIPMIPEGPWCVAYNDPTRHPRLRRRFVEVGRLRWSVDGKTHCHGGWQFSDPRVLLVFELSSGLKFATFDPAEEEWEKAAPIIGPWHKREGGNHRYLWARAVQWGKSRLIEEVSFSRRMKGIPRVDIIPAETIADRYYNPIPSRSQSGPQELYLTARDLQGGTPPWHWSEGAPGATLTDEPPFFINNPSA